MISPILNSANAAEALRSSYLEMKWYAAYTSANHEKRVREQLDLRCVASFLPLYKTVRRWKDRRVQLHLPLFPGYLFVRIALVDRLRVLQIPSVVRLVGFNGHPSPLSDQEIESLKNGLAGNIRVEPYRFLTAGRRVRIKSGPLEGRQGILIRRKGRFRVVLSIELIQRSLAVDVDIADVQPLTGCAILSVPSDREDL